MHFPSGEMRKRKSELWFKPGNKIFIQCPEYGNYKNEMNTSRKINKLNAYKYIQHPFEKLLEINFTWEEMVDLLKDSTAKRIGSKSPNAFPGYNEIPIRRYIFAEVASVNS